METDIKTDIKTDIMHAHNFNQYVNNVNGWMLLCYGHDDSRLTGGAFYYVGDKDEAQVMADERMAEARKDSDWYYSRPWV
jgi:hypothetical protein